MSTKGSAGGAHTPGKCGNARDRRHKPEDLFNLITNLWRFQQTPLLEVSADGTRKIAGWQGEDLLDVPGSDDRAGRQHCPRDQSIDESEERHRSTELGGWRKHDEEGDAVGAVGKPPELVLLFMAVHEPPDNRQPSGG